MGGIVVSMDYRHFGVWDKHPTGLLQPDKRRLYMRKINSFSATLILDHSQVVCSVLIPSSLS